MGFKNICKCLTDYEHTIIADTVYVHSKCEPVLASLPKNSIDVIVTSPPYNLGVKYHEYNDRQPEDEYLSWLENCIDLMSRVLKTDGSLFLNVAGSARKPHLPWSVMSIALRKFKLQNQIIWLKSAYVPDTDCTFGHFKPINSDYFLNNLYEFVFHFTSNGKVPINRLSIGVPYSDKSNIKRWNKEADLRCGGNVWFIPYKTRQKTATHPSQFPVELAKRCILLHGKENAIVLDPFAGVGNTSIACALTGRSCISIEMDKKYYEESID